LQLQSVNTNLSFPSVEADRHRSLTTERTKAPVKGLPAVASWGRTRDRISCRGARVVIKQIS